MDGRQVKTTYKWDGEALVGTQKWDGKETTLKWEATGIKLTCVSFINRSNQQQMIIWKKKFHHRRSKSLQIIGVMAQGEFIIKNIKINFFFEKNVFKPYDMAHMEELVE